MFVANRVLKNIAPPGLNLVIGQLFLPKFQPYWLILMSYLFQIEKH